MWCLFFSSSVHWMHACSVKYKVWEKEERWMLVSCQLIIEWTWGKRSENYKTFQYKLKRCSEKECCKQCRYVKFKGTMTKWPVQKPTHRTTQKTRRTPWPNRHLEKKKVCTSGSRGRTRRAPPPNGRGPMICLCPKRQYCFLKIFFARFARD